MTRVNCHADYRFRVRARIPNTAGALATPAAGVLTGLTLRLAATPTGTAIDPAVGALAATEETGEAGTFYVVGDKADLETHVLPLGAGAPFYGIWSKAGDADFYTKRYIVADRTPL